MTESGIAGSRPDSQNIAPDKREDSSPWCRSSHLSHLSARSGSTMSQILHLTVIQHLRHRGLLKT